MFLLGDILKIIGIGDEIEDLLASLFFKILLPPFQIIRCFDFFGLSILLCI